MASLDRARVNRCHRTSVSPTQESQASESVAAAGVAASSRACRANSGGSCNRSHSSRASRIAARNSDCQAGCSNGPERARYVLRTLAETLDTFLGRFFANQFKRNCVPDGPKVGSVSLSPRGDWRMPSDADSDLFRGE